MHLSVHKLYTEVFCVLKFYVIKNFTYYAECMSWVEFCLPNSSVEVLTPSASDCDLI